MKKASWGHCVLVFDSTSQPSVDPENNDSCAAGGYQTEFEVGRTTSCEVGVDATVSAPIAYESSMS